MFEGLLCKKKEETELSEGVKCAKMLSAQHKEEFELIPSTTEEGTPWGSGSPPLKHSSTG